MTHQRRNKPESTEALVERVREALELASHANHRDWSPIEIERAAGKALVALTELAEQLAAAEAGWQEAEHPFDKAEFDRMAERLTAAERNERHLTNLLDWRTKEKEAAERERDHLRSRIESRGVTEAATQARAGAAIILNESLLVELTNAKEQLETVRRALRGLWELDEHRRALREVNPEWEAGIVSAARDALAAPNPAPKPGTTFLPPGAPMPPRGKLIGGIEPAKSSPATESAQ